MQHYALVLAFLSCHAPSMVDRNVFQNRFCLVADGSVSSMDAGLLPPTIRQRVMKIIKSDRLTMHLTRGEKIMGGLLLVVLLTVFLVYYYAPSESSPHRTSTPSDPVEDALSRTDCLNALEHNHELLTIKKSVLKQLATLECKVAAASRNATELVMKAEEWAVRINKLTAKAEFLRSSIIHLELAQTELKTKQSPKVLKPLRLEVDESGWVELPVPSKEQSEVCTMERCFDYSRCPLNSEFKVYVDSTVRCRDGAAVLVEALKASRYAVEDFRQACMNIVPVCHKGDVENLSSLEHWKGDGRNHVILNAASDRNTSNAVLGRALVVSDTFGVFRHAFDMVIPDVANLWPTSSGKDKMLPMLAPARRKLLLYFEGRPPKNTYKEGPFFKALQALISETSDISPMDITLSCTQNNLENSYSCDSYSWCLCSSSDGLAQKLEMSTYALIIWNDNVTDVTALYRVLMGLKYGAVPVVLGAPTFPLEFVDWSRMTIQLPKARISEVYGVIRAIRDEDLLQYRRQGRGVWETYFASPEVFGDALLDTLRTRLNIPAMAVASAPFVSLFAGMEDEVVWHDVPKSEVEFENVGPVEGPYPSDTFQRNFSTTTLDRYSEWNVQMEAGALYPVSPFLPDMPSDAKFRGSEFGFRPIGGGAGGSGKEFSEALGGNYPREQFTAVILTYEREAVLSKSLARLNNLPYLNKVVVIWNSPEKPSELLTLPKLHVPTVIHKAERNSLNNRFLPLDVIETEAVLSLDDDVFLRHDEIVFGFRVWRENRERIVGFPTRYNAWDSEHRSWLYNSNHTCEYSMILTGASFFHKYYTYIYTNKMQPSIRAKVDEFMNCEDIAMNFLVAHLTKKPPIKVTSRWTFQCADCPVSLWEDESHFTERHQCMQFFEKVYGYMPLLNSQFRADSVLFKTRIPMDKQKCFKLI
ncbi:hypothetical protein RvY_14204-2 [Ramazzottius varieornatus]|uniref:glucuronosyl-galactosyl-proteoglycan 4-alpha-N-acetylglucosaminyltransferase n=1 Tax=Ramazzottius varieornatus TaxID=947166 RepID=A0A1D1VVL1_RAMVA|nr:hypothetical protein RvY_14204-2 [Ramazzottius varieornatus]